MFKCKFCGKLLKWNDLYWELKDEYKVPTHYLVSKNILPTIEVETNKPHLCEEFQKKRRTRK